MAKSISGTGSSSKSNAEPKKDGTGSEGEHEVSNVLSGQDWSHLDKHIETEVFKRTESLKKELTDLKKISDDHFDHHGSRIWKDFVGWVKDLGVVSALLGFSILGLIGLIGFFVSRNIADLVIKTIDSRQCLPSKQTVSAGTFCIK